ncbi:GNAT family N-acetyltransferase [Streptomyces zhihengii]
MPPTAHQDHTARIDVAPLQRPDHADYIELLELTTVSGHLPPEVRHVLTLLAAQPPSTHGTALCLTARPRRSTHPKPAGALLASFPDWAFHHPLTQNNPALAQVLSRTVLLIYGVATAPTRRRQGIARTLLTEAEDRARTAGYGMTTLLHAPHLTDFYEHLGYTTAHHVTIALPDAAMGLTQPQPCLTAVKALRPDIHIRKLPGAPGPVVTGLLPGWDLPPTARFEDGHLIT